MATCKKYLLGLVSDGVFCLIKSNLPTLLSLPFSAIMELLESEDLIIESENSIVYLLHHWLAAHPGCSANEMDRIARSVRVSQCTPSFLHGVLPKLPWFQSCLHLLPIATTFLAMAEYRAQLNGTMAI